jgi:hypothetical protein
VEHGWLGLAARGEQNPRPRFSGEDELWGGEK